MIPAWLLDIFAAVMLVVAAVSAARLTAARPWLAAARPWRGGAGRTRAYVDIAHLLMALAMAGMLAVSLQTLPDGAWEVIFGLMTAFFAYRVLRDARVSGLRALAGGHCAPHLIHAASMLYMFLALTGPVAGGSGGMAGMGGMATGSAGTLEFPVLAFAFTLLLVGYNVWDLDQLSGPGVSKHYSPAPARVAPVAVLAGVASGGPAGAPAGNEALIAGAARETGPGPSGPGPSGPGPSGPGPSGPERSEAGRAGSSGAPGDGQGPSILAPWVAVSCRIAMGVTMAFMLIIMI